MARTTLFSAALLGSLAVLIGAFGAHSLNDTLISNDRVDTFDTASRYHFYHSVSLLFIGYYLRRGRSQLLRTSVLFTILGIVVFSGSLYTLSLTNLTVFGAITPVGGFFLLLGWILLAIYFYKKL